MCHRSYQLIVTIIEVEIGTGEEVPFDSVAAFSLPWEAIRESRAEDCRSLTSFGMTIYGGTEVESHHLARKLKERATPAAKNLSQRRRTGVSALHNPSTRVRCPGTGWTCSGITT